MVLDVYRLIHHTNKNECGTKLTQGTNGTHQKRNNNNTYSNAVQMKFEREKKIKRKTGRIHR